jgi:hypothetical protein
VWHVNYGLRYVLAGSVSDRKSTSGVCFSLGSTMISWASRKHKSVALSTAKAEYIAACDACMEEVWLCKIGFELFDQALGFDRNTL